MLINLNKILQDHPLSFRTFKVQNSLEKNNLCT